MRSLPPARFRQSPPWPCSCVTEQKCSRRDGAHKHRPTSDGVMTFLLLWWAASRPVQTCRVTLDVESTPASLSLTQLRHWRPTLCSRLSHTHTQTHTDTHRVVYDHSFSPPDMQPRLDVKSSKTPTASILLCFWSRGGIIVCTCCWGGECVRVCVCNGFFVCSCMSARRLTLKECVRFHFTHLGYCM